MTAASPGPHLFSIWIDENQTSARRREAFAASLIAQAALLALIIYLTGHVIGGPELPRQISDLKNSLVFYGNAGGGGALDRLPASHGNPPPASAEAPIVPATVMVPTAMPKLPVEQSVVAPDIKVVPSAQIGDPNSTFSQWLSNGRGGPGGIGNEGCCDGVGNFRGPYGGSRQGTYYPGRDGVSVPQPIYSPEPSFSDEARKAKQQGIVVLMLVVGADGRPYNIHVRQSLGMGLDEKAIEAVRNWRFRPATLNGQPVATQIAVEVNFRLY